MFTIYFQQKKQQQNYFGIIGQPCMFISKLYSVMVSCKDAYLYNKQLTFAV